MRRIKVAFTQTLYETIAVSPFARLPTPAPPGAHGIAVRKSCSQ